MNKKNNKCLYIYLIEASQGLCTKQSRGQNNEEDIISYKTDSICRVKTKQHIKEVQLFLCYSKKKKVQDIAMNNFLQQIVYNFVRQFILKIFSVQASNIRPRGIQQR